MSAIRTMYVTSLDAMQDDGFDLAASASGPGEQLDGSRLASRLRAAIDALPERERALMTKHYWEGKNLLEAGAELGISKSWASRLHAQAVDRLRRLSSPVSVSARYEILECLDVNGDIHRTSSEYGYTTSDTRLSFLKKPTPE